MNNTEEYDKVSYKKYKSYCILECQELRERGCEVDFQTLSFENFVKKVKEDSQFAKIWGYWNFL